jgi:hypothetical protein
VHRARRRACLARVVVRAAPEIWDSKSWSSSFVFVEVVTFRAIFFNLDAPSSAECLRRLKKLLLIMSD